MLGYVFEVTNLKTGDKYIGKAKSVAFNKNYFGDDEELSKAVEKYGRAVFECKMLMPYETEEALEVGYKKFTNAVPKKKVVRKKKGLVEDE